MYIQRPERVFVTCFLCIFDVTITCSKLNYYCGCVFKVDSFLKSTTNALPKKKKQEYKVDPTPLQTPLHSTPRLHSMTPLRKLHGARRNDVKWVEKNKTM